MQQHLYHLHCFTLLDFSSQKLHRFNLLKEARNDTFKFVFLIKLDLKEDIWN